jgi:hypothetical protein
LADVSAASGIDENWLRNGDEPYSAPILPPLTWQELLAGKLS